MLFSQVDDGSAVRFLQRCWPVGSVFTSVVDTDPAALLGFGVWASLGAGCVLVGKDVNQTEFNTLEGTGGEKTHALTTTEMPAHTHTQDPHGHAVTDPTHNHTQNSHSHTIQMQGGTTAATTGTHIMNSTAVGGSSRGATAPDATNTTVATNQAAATGLTVNNATATNQNAGGGVAHNNLQPYCVVRFWKRTS